MIFLSFLGEIKLTQIEVTQYRHLEVQGSSSSRYSCEFLVFEEVVEYTVQIQYQSAHLNSLLLSFNLNWQFKSALLAILRNVENFVVVLVLALGIDRLVFI